MRREPPVPKRLPAGLLAFRERINGRRRLAYYDQVLKAGLMTAEQVVRRTWIPEAVHAAPTASDQHLSEGDP